ncbi:MAG: hypothetical protein AAF656_11835 [Planctomycetota bacterium]
MTKPTWILSLMAVLLAFPAVAAADYRGSSLDRARAKVDRAERDVRDAKFKLQDALAQRDAIADALRQAQRHGGRLDDLRDALIRAERDLAAAEKDAAFFTQEARVLDRLLREHRAFHARCIDPYVNEREIGRLRFELERLESDLERGRFFGNQRDDLIRRIERVRFELRVRIGNERAIRSELQHAINKARDAERFAEQLRCDVRDLRAELNERSRFDVFALRRDLDRAERFVDDARCHLDRAESNLAVAVREFDRARRDREYASYRDDRRGDRDRHDGRDDRRPRERYRR